jgi:O-antigen/teichoic acid export membrane protein
VTQVVEAAADSAAPEVHRRANQALKAMLVRQGLLQVLTLTSGIILSRTLRPAEFGMFAIATFVVSCLGMLGDFGLAPSFIQRKSEITNHELRVAFTVQQVLTAAVVGLLWVSAPAIAILYKDAPSDFSRSASF